MLNLDFGSELDARGCRSSRQRSLNGLASGQIMEIVATDLGSVKDMQAFAKQIGHILLAADEDNKMFVY